jgi:hypothetical protein
LRSHEKTRYRNATECNVGDDLTLIPGIGQRYQEALKGAGIWHYADLAELAPEDVRDILQVGCALNDPSGAPPPTPALAELHRWSVGAKALAAGAEREEARHLPFSVRAAYRALRALPNTPPLVVTLAAARAEMRSHHHMRNLTFKTLIVFIAVVGGMLAVVLAFTFAKGLIFVAAAPLEVRSSAAGLALGLTFWFSTYVCLFATLAVGFLWLLLKVVDVALVLTGIGIRLLSLRTWRERAYAFELGRRVDASVVPFLRWAAPISVALGITVAGCCYFLWKSAEAGFTGALAVLAVMIIAILWRATSASNRAAPGARSLRDCRYALLRQNALGVCIRTAVFVAAFPILLGMTALSHTAVMHAAAPPLMSAAQVVTAYTAEALGGPSSRVQALGAFADRGQWLLTGPFAAQPPALAATYPVQLARFATLLFVLSLFWYVVYPGLRAEGRRQVGLLAVSMAIAALLQPVVRAVLPAWLAMEAESWVSAILVFVAVYVLQLSIRPFLRRTYGV